MTFPANPESLKKAFLKRKSIDLLPQQVGFVNGSTRLKKFLTTTLDQWIQEKSVIDASGYIGKRGGKYYTPENTYYLEEPTKDRYDYQLEPTAVSVDDEGSVNFTNFYQDLINYLRSHGALVNNHSRLFEQEYYSWCPPVNVDMLVNFTNYYWLDSGSTTVEITDQTNYVLDILGKKQYTTSSNISLQSGMRIVLRNDDNVEYNNISYIVEGVGESIVLIDDSEYDTITEQSVPDYITIARNSKDRNSWSRTNRWFHKDLITDLNVSDFSASQARRPIIEFIPDIQLHNQGRIAREDVSSVALNTSVLDIVGQSSYSIDGHMLVDGDRILFVDDQDPTKNNKIWKVYGLDAYGTIGLQVETDGETVDGSPYFGEKVRVSNGTINKNKEFYFDGSTWKEGQVKTFHGQEPLFELYDYDKNSLGDEGLYPENDYAPSKIFSYTQNGNEVDQYIGIPISFDTFGNIQFTNHLVDTRYSYIINFEEYEIGGYYYYKVINDIHPSNDSYETDWHKSETFSRQMVRDNFIIEEKTLDNGQTEFTREYELSIVPDANTADVINYKLFLNGTELEDGIDYNISGKELQLSLSLQLEDNDVLEVLQWAEEIPDTIVNGYFEIPTNLESNPNNLEVDRITFSGLQTHLLSIIENQINFEGNVSGANNYRNTERDLSKGINILSHTSPLLKLMLVTGNENLDIISAIRFSGREYTRFKNKFIKKIIQLSKQGYDSTVPAATWVNDALQSLNIGKTSDFPFANSQMAGGQYWIPSTAAALGVTPVYQPEIFVDNTRLTPVTVIRGHDGSIIDATNSYIDNVILELETRIFNNINAVYKNKDRIFELDILDTRAGYFRDTRYSRDEWNYISKSSFESWAIKNQVDYTSNTSYDPNNRFTWNYSRVKAPNGEFLQGFWRGIYQYFYDTDRPHTHPWEMLGFSQKPDWWDTEYGTSPYTGTNVVMWTDIENGYIRQGNRQGTHAHLVRTGLSNMIPVDSSGNLLDPIAAGVATSIPSSFEAQRPWKYGDGAPAEYTFRSSELYSFAVAETLFLAFPARFVELCWNSSLLTRENTQLVYSDIHKRKNTEQNNVHNEIQDDGTAYIGYGITQWISDLLSSNGQNIRQNFGNLVRDMDVRLGYKVGGFTKENTTRLLTDSFGLIPQENISTILYRSASIEEPVYSGVIVVWTGSVYRVMGYDRINQKFHVNPVKTNGKKSRITIDGIDIVRHVEFTKEVKEVPYNTAFTSRQQVYDFFIGYQSYLESVGWEFDQEDTTSNTIKDYETSARQFVAWTSQSLKPNDAIIFSPLADKAKISITHGIVDSLQDYSSGSYSVLNASNQAIPKDSYEIDRFDNEFTITLNSDYTDGIYGVRLNVITYEHAILVDNQTIFNDLIYSPLLGLRQLRLRAFIQKTDNWEGRPEANGFIIRENTLFDNFEKSVSDIRFYFDIENMEEPTIQKAIAKHQIGYQDREYMNSLLLSRKSQFEFYKGFIREKGTNNSFSKILRNSFITQSSDFELLEEWAFLDGEYGNIKNKSRIELDIIKNQFKTNPQVVRFVETQPTVVSSIISIDPNDSRWVLKNSNNETIQQFDTRGFEQGSRFDLPSGGYIQVEEADYTIISMTDENLQDLYLTVTLDNRQLNDGDIIWNPVKNASDWTVYRLCDTGNVLMVNQGAEETDPTVITTDTPHNLVQGDRIFILGSTESSPEFEGYNIVENVLSSTTFTLETPCETEKDFSPNVGPTILVLREVRFSTISERNSFTPPNGWIEGDKTFIDDNGNSRWDVQVWNGTSWDIDRTENDKVDISQIYSALIYNSQTDITNTYLEIFDPFKGYIVSAADKEISFKLDFDPAKYTDGNAEIYQIDPEQAWSDSDVGKLWWDLSTVRFVDYEQGDTQYRTRYWGKIVDGTSVDIYEWTKSPVSPDAWDSFVNSQGSGAYRYTGELKDGTEQPYVTKTEYDNKSDTFRTYYYFWVKNPSFVPVNIDQRNLSALAVSNLITNPRSQSVPCFAPISQEEFAVFNVDIFMDDSDSVIQINFNKDADNSIIHKQWKLHRDNDTTEVPPIRQWNKMRDSLVGYDDLGNSVPDTNLLPSQRYGSKIRPRQSWFMDKNSAREVLVDKTNKLLILRNVVDTDPDWDNNLYNFEPQPDASMYDEVVFDRNARNALENTILAGKKVLVEQDQVYNNKWSLWQYNGASSWTLLDLQQYRDTDFWSYTDWYESGYSAETKIDYTFADIPTRDSNVSLFVSNNIIKVEDNGTGRWALYRFDIQNSVPTWFVIGQENGTIQLSSGLYEYDTTDTYKETETSIVVKNLLFALRENILTIKEQNNLFFALVNYVLTEQKVVDWVFKTSYVYGTGSSTNLEQSFIYVQDQSNNLLRYFEEAKPYHVKIRGLIDKKRALDVANVLATDFHEMLITLKFDRVSCESNIPEGANPKDYNIDELSAADRVQLLYQPTEGMPEKVLEQIISRCEYGGTVLDGKGFYQFGTLIGAGYDNSEYDYQMGYDFDASDIENYYDIFVNGGSFDNSVPTSQGDAGIIVDGHKFIQPEIGDCHPEELVKVRAGDSVIIDVYSESTTGLLQADENIIPVNEFDETDLGIPFGGAPRIRVKRYRGTAAGTTGVFTVGQQPQSEEAIFVFVNGDLLINGTDYTVAWSSNPEITLTNPIFETDELKIQSFSVGGSSVLKEKAFENTSDTVFDMGENIVSDSQVFVSVDGTVAQFTTSGTEVTVSSPTPSNSYVHIVLFNNTQISVINTQEEIAAGGTETFIIDNPAQSTIPNYATTLVHRNGLRVTPPFQTVYSAIQGENKLKIGKNFNDYTNVTVWTNGTELVQGIDYYVAYIAGVVPDDRGSGYTVGDVITITGTGTGASAVVTEIDGNGGIIGINMLTVGFGYDNSTIATAGGTGTGATLVPTLNTDEIFFANNLNQGDLVVIMILEEHGFEIVNGDELTLLDTTTGSPLSLIAGDRIKITSFSEDLALGMRTQVYTGTDRAFYLLAEQPFDTNSLWVTVNGEVKTHLLDFVIVEEEQGYDSEYQGYGILYDDSVRKYGISFKNQTHTETDDVVVTLFTGIPAANPIAFRLFKDIFGNWTHYRISDKASTVLVQDLQPSDQTIVVEDATVLGQPDIANNIAGVIFINNERITFWNVDTSVAGAHVLSGVMRGTKGSGINLPLTAGQVVRDGSLNQVIPTGYYWSYTPYGLQYDNSTLAKFLLAESGTFDYGT